MPFFLSEAQPMIHISHWSASYRLTFKEIFKDCFIVFFKKKLKLPNPFFVFALTIFVFCICFAICILCNEGWLVKNNFYRWCFFLRSSNFRCSNRQYSFFNIYKRANRSGLWMKLKKNLSLFHWDLIADIH